MILGTQGSRDVGELVGWFELGVKWGLVVTLLVYLVFAVLVIRQISLMVESFETPREGVLRFFGFAHVGLVLLLLVVTLVVL